MTVLCARTPDASLSMLKGPCSSPACHNVSEGAIALEIQHLSPQIIDRLNSYYGHAAISRLNIIQGPVTITPSPLNPPPIKEEDISALADDFEEIETPRLKRALASLALLMRRDKG